MAVLKELARQVLPAKLVARIRYARVRALYAHNVVSVDSSRDFQEKAGRRDFMRKAFCTLSFNGISGDYFEFGSWGARTFMLAFEESRRASFPCKMWAFDSFCGLPPQESPKDDHPAWVEGDMNTSLEEFQALCFQNGIPQSEYTTVAGYYKDTIGRKEVAETLPMDVSLAYIDCDLYSSTMAVLQFLKRRMKHGMIVALDDYYCYSGQNISGERRACLEYLHEDRRFHFLPYVQFGWGGMSFIVENRSILPSEIHTFLEK